MPVEVYKWVKSGATWREIARRFKDSKPEPGDKPYRLRFTGQCPDCEDLMVWDYPLVAVAGGGGGTDIQQEAMRDAAADAGLDLRVDQDVTMICDCKQPHKGRPDDVPAEGCGRYWNIHVKWPKE